VPGTFAYTPAAGTVLGAGSHTLFVLFTPTDTTNYRSVVDFVTLTVDRATLTGTGGDNRALSVTSLTATPLLAHVAMQRSPQSGQTQGATLTFNAPVNLNPRALQLVRMRKGRPVKDLSRWIQIIMVVHDGQTWAHLRFRSPQGQPLARGRYSLFVQHDLVRHTLTDAALTGSAGSSQTEIRFSPQELHWR